jgi:hypothetical protein
MDMIFVRKDPTEIGWEGVGWLHPVQGRIQWRDIVNTEMKLPVP